MGLEDIAEEAEDVESEENGEPVEIEATVSETQSDTGGLVRLVDDLDQIAEVYQQLEDVKTELLSSADTTSIGDNEHINKSGWRKIATAFNISVDVIDDEMWVEDGVVKAKVRARATAPNGKSATSVGMCASNESNHMEAGAPKDGDPDDHPDYYYIDDKWRRLKDPREVKEHNIYTIAATRAKNRAISDCVGGGEVSAEEVQSKEEAFEDV